MAKRQEKKDADWAEGVSLGQCEGYEFASNYLMAIAQDEFASNHDEKAIILREASEIIKSKGNEERNNHEKRYPTKGIK